MLGLSDQGIEQKLKAAARRNTALFARVWRRDVRPGPHQYDMAKRIDNENNLYQGDWWPRDHGKSEIFCIAYPLRRICEDPNVRILIVQKTATEAEKTLSVIKTELETNAGLKRFYAGHWQQAVGTTDISNASGNVLVGGRKEGAWRQSRIYVKRSRRSKDPTVEAVGIGGAITGGHYDVIVLDDIEDDENCRTEERMGYIKRWFSGTILQLREPDTKTIVVGTLKTPANDLYKTIQDNPMWNCKVVSALLSHNLDDIEYETIRDDEGIITDVEVKTQNVVTLWPSKWGIRELLLDMLADPSRAIWVREKLNDLGEMVGKVFKTAWFQYYSVEQLPIEFDETVQIWDTALTDKKSSDWSTCITGGIHKGNLYILHVRRERLKFPALRNRVQEMYDAWEPDRLYIENKASGISLLQVLRTETSVPVLEAKPGNKSKVERAHAITVYPESGRVYLPIKADWLDVFIAELMVFPEGNHDDQVDVFVYIIYYGLIRGKKRRAYHGLIERKAA